MKPEIRKVIPAALTDEDLEEMLDEMLEKIKAITARQQEGIPPSADWLELDNDGNVVGWGTDADFDTHALQVMNGEGYYDDDGHYQSYHLYAD